MDKKIGMYREIHDTIDAMVREAERKREASVSRLYLSGEIDGFSIVRRGTSKAEGETLSLSDLAAAVRGMTKKERAHRASDEYARGLLAGMRRGLSVIERERLEKGD